MAMHPSGIGTLVEAVDASPAQGVRARLRLASARSPRACVVWLPALGVPARAYDTLAGLLAGAGVSVLVHEWRGIGSSTVRASRQNDWGYAQLLHEDIALTNALADEHMRDLPRVWAGHSLGGQFAALALASGYGRGDGLALVASGTPHWPRQRMRVALALMAAMVAVPAITSTLGHLPGRRIGFGGRESRGVMRDWLRCARTGRYQPDASTVDLETQLGRLDTSAFGLCFAEDRFAPRTALDALLAKTASRDVHVATLDRTALGVRADHFSWMHRPDAVSAELLAWMDDRFGIAACQREPER